MNELATVFAALADRTRLRLLNLMTEGEVCVWDLARILGEPQPKISRHLAFLRRAALVTARREGKWMHYSLMAPANAAARHVVEQTLAVLRDDAGMTRDRVALAKKQRTPAIDREPSTIFFFE